MKNLLLALLTLPLAACAADLPAPAEPVVQSREKYGKVTWMARHEAILERHKQVKPEVVFFGDSITHHWAGEPAAYKVIDRKSWQVATCGRLASNLGFGYDYIENARWRVANGELDGIAPKVVVVLLGTNNLGHKKDTPEAAAATMKALLQDIRAKLPQTKILLLGVYPRKEPALAEPIRALNREYAKLAGGPVVFRDVGEVLNGKPVTEGGAPAADLKYLRDTVHPSAAGYAKVAPLIAAEIRKLVP